MALSLSAQSLLGKISSGHLECSICFSRFQQPKVLDCLHSFCLKCLIQLRRRKEPPSSTLICPLCRRETTLKDVADLPNNFTISALVEEVTMQEKLLEGQGSEIKCQSCEEENPAVSRCMDCDQFLCQECQRAHERLAMMKSHKVYTLAQLRSGEIAYKSKLRDVPKCGKHTDQNLCFYCNTCERLVCTTCCILDHTKPEHSLIGLPEALDKCKHDIAKVSAKAEQSKTDLCIAMEEIDTSIKKLDTNFDDTGKKISKKADEEVATIREEEQLLKQELKKVYEDRLKTFETAQATNNKEVTQAEQKLDEVNQLVAQASSYEIIDLRLKLLHNLEELTGTQPEKVSDSLSFMNFEEAEKSLGILTLEEPKLDQQPNVAEPVKPEKLVPGENWEFKTQIKTFGPEQTAFGQAFDVAVFSNNEIIVADTRHRQLVTFMHPGKRQSTAEPQVLKISGLTDPSRISVNKDDQLIVLDGHVVKIFSREYTFLHQFIPGRGFGPGSKPTCLAVDENNTIAVGYKYKEEISLHNPDGSLIRTLPAPMIGYYLTTCRRRLIYTNWDKNKLQSVGYDDGHVIFSVEISNHLHETGVCCNGDGGIFVAVSGDWSTGEIHRFGPDGEHIGCVIESCGTPSGITLTPDGGDLVVAAGYSVKIFNNA